MNKISLDKIKEISDATKADYANSLDSLSKEKFGKVGLTKKQIANLTLTFNQGVDAMANRVRIALE